MTREGFEHALSQACLSHYDPNIYPDPDTWRQLKNRTPVRVQWDPERDISLAPLPWRTIQIGLTGTAAHAYVNHWITSIKDVTHVINQLRRSADSAGIEAPTELPYPLPRQVAEAINATA